MKVPRQPEINIGMVGHVDHGKTALTRVLTGEWTDRHSEEIKRGISIRLGYADAAFFKCKNCEGPEAYTTGPECPNCEGEAEFLRAVSFVDAPGHETLMATMLSGATIMNGAILLIAANEECPQPQTREHLMALDICGVSNVVVVQNKIDIISKEDARKNYDQIREFLKGTKSENAPIIPLSAHHSINVDHLIYTIENRIPTPEFNDKEDPRMYIARSFDANVPGTGPEKLIGGIIGGTLIKGSFRGGDEIEISPGRKTESHGKTSWSNISTKVTSLQAGGKNRKEAKPGGLIGVATTLDPTLTKSDNLVGRIVGTPGTLPNVLFSFSMKTNLMERVVGAAKDLKVEGIKTNEPLMLSIGTATTVGLVKSVRDETAEVNLKIPVSAEKGQRIALSRKILGKWRLIGFGVIET
jgi:translation initiation factor 2 subunit 3